MAENYKHRYQKMKKMVEKYQDEIVPSLFELIEEMKKNRLEVVRCKDCKRSRMYRFFLEEKESLACVDVEDGEVVFAQRVSENHFCSYGEKREE